MERGKSRVFDYLREKKSAVAADVADIWQELEELYDKKWALFVLQLRFVINFREFGHFFSVYLSSLTAMITYIG